ncbi:MAG: DUF2628 domain-containing protein [Luteibacter sp.]|jgi:hypothetical protein|uniref:DUF2628 domain-containing protein n=1 Tax=Rhodanobacteraceae TaxID=1775411 RepID=UPI0005641483|nr:MULTISPECIES: DUF2628 domain-containing protein [Rhodanobacteraceae]MDQ7997708.1 DUF2628 domain-containing protein [Luteibacter sp.]MDQ8049559.1 DUF2628 domain-containing protein [Luteibacter sp.]MDR6641500.1 hypothetical protein [Luteibacter sp. 1214]SDF66154.1 Protein of unknown function [Dyella sp. 333MFSha]SKB62510.1 Protein of unknown function [Luteibacter sp. 22Crub2.1]
MAEAEFVSDPSLNAKWNTRFAFFERFGGPSSPQYKAELKKLPFRQKLIVNGNFFAFFFGPIYFFILGLWKKALVILGLEVAIIIALMIFNAPDGFYRGVGTGFNVFYMLVANYAYYLKRVKGQDNWSPFEGMRL